MSKCFFFLFRPVSSFTLGHPHADRTGRLVQEGVIKDSGLLTVGRALTEGKQRWAGEFTKGEVGHSLDKVKIPTWLSSEDRQTNRQTD